MNREFKLRFDQMKEGNPARPEASPPGELEEPLSLALTLCLGWPDGKRFFLSYAYLMAGEFSADGEQNRIVLYFTSYTVTLKGYELVPLFQAVSDRVLAWVSVTESRYVTPEETGRSVVTEIMVEKPEE